MEKELKRLFEYQKFENNARLAALIAETENRYRKEIDEEDLFYVNAAQGVTMPAKDTPEILKMLDPEQK